MMIPGYHVARDDVHSLVEQRIGGLASLTGIDQSPG